MSTLEECLIFERVQEDGHSTGMVPFRQVLVVRIREGSAPSQQLTLWTVCSSKGTCTGPL